VVTLADRYRERKERERRRQADQSREGRDIGQIPKVADPKLRERCSKSFRAFCETCFPGKFYIGWSPDHLEVLAMIQACITEGQLYTLAMPRGSGKTTIVQVACLWAILTGQRRFVALIGADRDAAIKLLVALKAELESNETLLALFPEAVYPIRQLQGRANKAIGQLHLGKRTHIEWKGPRIVFPTIRAKVGEDAQEAPKSASKPAAKGKASKKAATKKAAKKATKKAVPKSAKQITPDNIDDLDENGVESDNLTPCSGAVIECCGILGRVRGMNHTTPDGQQIRPDLFVLDDPQTDRSAVSTSQVNRRLSIITGAVLGLAGPDVSIAGFATVTVIAKDDVADQLLDREKFPDWQGKRYQLVYKWPDRMDLWEQYAVLRAEGLRTEGNIKQATEWYIKNRDEMDRGSKPAWEGRYKPGEISAIQSAFNQKLRSPATFDAEFQNNPQDQAADVEIISVEDIEAKITNYARGELPIAANLITSFIDVQGDLLYYLVIGWEKDTFSGWVIEYGTWPEQVAKHFSLRNAQSTLRRKYPKRGLEGRLTAGLNDLIIYLAEQKYSVPSHQNEARSASIELIGIDQAWGPSTKTVRSICAAHPKRQLLLPCQGKAFGVGDRTLNDWALKPGELRGDNWVVRHSTDGGRHCLADSNAFKSFVNARLNVATGDPGSLSLYRPRLATEHRLIAEHWRAEKPKSLSDGDRSIEQWRLPPAKPDNHWWDGLYWCAVLASIRGARLGDRLLLPPKKTRKATRRRQTTLVA